MPFRQPSPFSECPVRSPESRWGLGYRAGGERSKRTQCPCCHRGDQAHSGVLEQAFRPGTSPPLLPSPVAEASAAVATWFAAYRPGYTNGKQLQRRAGAGVFGCLGI